MKERALQVIHDEAEFNEPPEAALTRVTKALDDFCDDANREMFLNEVPLKEFKPWKPKITVRPRTKKTKDTSSSNDG